MPCEQEQYKTIRCGLNEARNREHRKCPKTERDPTYNELSFVNHTSKEPRTKDKTLVEGKKFHICKKNAFLKIMSLLISNRLHLSSLLFPKLACDYGNSEIL